VTRAVLAVDGGLETPWRCWWLVRPAGRIAEWTRDASASATIVAHRFIGMLFANPTHAAAAGAWFACRHTATIAQALAAGVPSRISSQCQPCRSARSKSSSGRRASQASPRWF